MILFSDMDMNNRENKKLKVDSLENKIVVIFII